MVPYRGIPYEVVNSEKHQKLAINAVRQAIVLLKNSNNILPLKKNVKNIAVIGPNAIAERELLGNYVRKSFEITSILKGIKSAVSDETIVRYSWGCFRNRKSRLGEYLAKKIIEKSDVVIMAMGLSQAYESEEKRHRNADRESLNLPEHQIEFMKMVHDFGKPMILIVTNGSPLALNWAQHNIDAIVEAWYPGEKGGISHERCLAS